jgi:hypothetical protein
MSLEFQRTSGICVAVPGAVRILGTREEVVQIRSNGPVVAAAVAAAEPASPQVSRGLRWS